jgi:hypothetical protein
MNERKKEKLVSENLFFQWENHKKLLSHDTKREKRTQKNSQNTKNIHERKIQHKCNE